MDELNLKRDKSYHVVMEVCGRVACLRIAGRIHYPSIDSGCHCAMDGLWLAWCYGVTTPAIVCLTKM